MASRKRSPVQDQWANGPIVLLSFSDGVSARGPVPASQIFSDLVAEGVWYLPRASRYLLPNETTVLFYQSGSGIRGYALVLDIKEASEGEREKLNVRYGLSRILVKIRLGHVEVFPKPVPIGPLAQELQFVKNKVHWGHSVRTSPRTINDADFALIKRIAAKTTSAEREVQR